VVDTGIKKFYGNHSLISVPSRGKRFYGQDAQYKGNQPAYRNNGNGTITDKVTGLMWQQDMGKKMTWDEAKSHAKKSRLTGYTDWRFPNAKELQSIVDYTRSPQATSSPAIDPIFQTTAIKAPDNQLQYPSFWTSTNHQDGKNYYDSAVYIAFGRALGKMHGRIQDVHGAGAQRSDPKTGNPDDYPRYFGPQGDMRIVFNFVRCVRNID